MNGSAYYWLNVSACVVQLSSVAVIILLWRWHRCRVPWCLRPGRHQVGRTSWKVCDCHHTVPDHADLAAQHAETHPERIG